MLEIAKYLVKFVICRATFFRELLAWKPDVIHAHDLITLPCAANFATRSGSRLVYDAHELERGRNPPMSKLHKKIAIFLERRYGKKADALITVSNEIASVLKVDFPEDLILEVVYNSPKFTDNRNIPNVRAYLGLGDTAPLLVYVGGLLINRGIEKLIESLRFLPDFTLVCLGNDPGGQVSKLEQYADSLNVGSQVFFLNPVAPDMVVPFIRTADVGVYAIQNVCESYDYSMPNKLFEMVFAELPIAVSDLTSVRNFLTEYPVGQTFNQESPGDIARVVYQVYQAKNDYALSEEQFGQMAKVYSWQAQEEKLARIYSKIQKPNIDNIK